MLDELTNTIIYSPEDFPDLKLKYVATGMQEYIGIFFQDMVVPLCHFMQRGNLYIRNLSAYREILQKEGIDLDKYGYIRTLKSASFNLEEGYKNK